MRIRVFQSVLRATPIALFLILAQLVGATPPITSGLFVNLNADSASNVQLGSGSNVAVWLDQANDGSNGTLQNFGNNNANNRPVFTTMLMPTNKTMNVVDFTRGTVSGANNSTSSSDFLVSQAGGQTGAFAAGADSAYQLGGTPNPDGLSYFVVWKTDTISNPTPTGTTSSNAARRSRQTIIKSASSVAATGDHWGVLTNEDTTVTVTGSNTVPNVWHNIRNESNLQLFTQKFDVTSNWFISALTADLDGGVALTRILQSNGIDTGVVSIGTTNFTSPFSTHSNTLIGQGDATTNTTTAGAFDGQIAEILIYNTALSETDFGSIIGYLNNKYFVTTWDGNTDTDWSVGSNWDPDFTPTNNAAFLGTGQTQAPTANQPVLNGAGQAGGVNFNSGLGGWSISGAGTLTLGGGGIDATNQAHDGTNPITTYVTDTVSVANIVLNEDSTWNIGGNASYRKLSVSSTISGTRKLTVAGGSDSSTAGILELTGTNTYSGGTTVTGGTLQMGNTAALGEVTGSLTVNGGTLNLNGFSPTVGALSGTGGFITTLASGTATLTTNSSTNSTFAGVLKDGESGQVLALTKQGSTSALTLTGANTYTGGTNIDAGTLQFAQLNAMPDLGTVAVDSGATLTVNLGGLGEWTSSDVVADPGSLAGLIAGTGGQGTPNQVEWSSGSNLGIDTSNAGGSATYAGVIGQFATGGDTIGLTKLGSGTLILTASNTYTGDTTLNGGTLALGSSGAIGSVGTISFGGGTTLQFSASNTTDYSARFSTAAGQAYRLDTNGESVTLATALTSSGGSLTKLGVGTLSLTSANTYTGTTSVSGGTLEFATIGNVGSGDSNLGAPTTVANGTIALSGGGTLRYTGSGASTDRVLNLSGTATGGAVDASGSGAITFTSNLTATGGGSKTLTLRGTNTGDNTVNGMIGNGGGTTSVTKDDAGKWILGGANTYTGATTISAGTLLVNGSLASGSAVAVNGGVLGGTGTVGGSVTVASGGTLSPGASIESLGVGSLAMSGGKLTFELGAPGSPGVTSDLLYVVGANGLSITSGTVDLIDFGGLAVGTYTLVDYAGTAPGDATVNLLTLGLQPAGFAYDLVDNATNLSIDLVVTPGGVPGDYNGNGTVDSADYVVWRKNNGLTGGATVSQGNGDGDSDVDEDDYTYWRARFGNPTPGSGSGSTLGNSNVPEPTSIVVLLIGMAFIGMRRIQRGS